jgi:hypothetical protein
MRTPTTVLGRRPESMPRGRRALLIRGTPLGDVYGPHRLLPDMPMEAAEHLGIFTNAILASLKPDSRDAIQKSVAASS